jgi:hypothetical protein
MKLWFQVEWPDELGEQWMTTKRLNHVLQLAGTASDGLHKACSATRSMDQVVAHGGALKGRLPCGHSVRHLDVDTRPGVGSTKPEPYCTECWNFEGCEGEA